MDGSEEEGMRVMRKKIYTVVSLVWKLGQNAAEWVEYRGKIIPLGNLLISSASLGHCIATGLVTYRVPAGL